MDFSGLTDDQLLQLIQGAMAEAVKRGAAIAYAAHQTYDDAAQELRIKAEVAAKAAAAAEYAKEQRIKREAEADLEKKRAAAQAEQHKIEVEKQAERQKALWAKKCAIVQALVEDPLFKDKGHVQINVWDGSDLRVYIEGKNINKITYYKVGNNWHAIGSIEGVDKQEGARVRKFCDAVCSHWNTLKLHTSDVDPKSILPNQKHLAEYREALKVEEPSNV